MRLHVRMYMRAHMLPAPEVAYASYTPQALWAVTSISVPNLILAFDFVENNNNNCMGV